MAKSKSFRFMALLLFSLVLGFGVNAMANNGDTKLDPNSVLKTIVAGNEIIDCVDIYKQPAFKHPLLKNHTLQLKPSSYPTGSRSNVVNSAKPVQLWHKNGEYCPKGTIPIVRSSTADFPPKNKYDRLRASGNAITAAIPHPAGSPHPEFATAVTQGLDYYGIGADMSAWNPKVVGNESSSSQVWVTDGGGEKIEAVEAGWMVTPSKPHPKLFAYWTIDGYGESGCYNVDCPGFVLVDSKFSLGSQVQPTSTYGGQQHYLNFKISKDMKTSNWWLIIGNMHIGYWPADLFENLKASAQLLEWGGRVVNTDPNGVHTATEMGSGHFPTEGHGKAAWFKNLEYADGNGLFNDAADIEGRATRPECYDVKVQDWDLHSSASFLYGGPGYSPACRDI